MTLYINTRDQKQVTVSLKKDGKVVKSLSEQNEFGSQVLLPLIIKLLNLENTGSSIEIRSRIGRERELEKIEKIEVETGPGSFTGLRVGVSVANALGFALGIPVNGKKIETKLIY